MAKMTMHQELEMLRTEVEELKKQKTEKEGQEQLEALEAKERHQQQILEFERKAKEIKESLKRGETDAKEMLDHLMDTIKEDYKNLSPTSAIVLFALGAAFGNALSSK